MIFSITGKQLIGSRQGFLYTIGTKELILTDTTHIAITFSEISDFNLLTIDRLVASL